MFLCAAIALSSCKKKQEEIPKTELEKLPPATQVGANTFGALVNGQAFMPYSKALFASTYQCNYIFTNGGYYFTVGASNDNNYEYLTNIMLGTTKLPIAEGQIFKFNNYNEDGKAFGTYSIIYSVTTNEYKTNNIVNGQLYISKLDQTKQIVSGTFFYKAINIKGDTVKVTDGRFDMKYTQ